MNLKRWIALGAAVFLLIASIAINTLMSFLKSDFLSGFETLTDVELAKRRSSNQGLLMNELLYYL